MDARALPVNRRTDDNPLVERDLGEGVRFQLAVQSALADAQDLGRLATIALRLAQQDRKSTRLNSSHGYISYAVFCLKKKKRKLCSVVHPILKPRRSLVVPLC